MTRKMWKSLSFSGSKEDKGQEHLLLALFCSYDLRYRGRRQALYSSITHGVYVPVHRLLSLSAMFVFISSYNIKTVCLG